MKKAAVAVIAAFVAGPVLADPLVDALASDGGTLCFTRSYDDAWLNAHAGQTLRGVTLAVTDDGWVGQLNMRLALNLPSGPLYGFGQCYWDNEINRGVQNDILDPGFKPTTGITCHMMTDITGGSAEEGAEFSVDWRDDGRTIEAHLGDALAMWSSYDISDTANWYDWKSADRIVRLNRVKPSDCEALVTNFAPKGLDS